MRLRRAALRVRRGLVVASIAGILGSIGPGGIVAAAAASLPALLPVGDGTRDAAIQVRGVTLAYDAIDESIAAADTTSYLQNAQKTSGRAIVLLGDMPADFVSMSSLTISIRARTVGLTDDQTALFAQLVGADETTPLSGEVPVATNPGPSGWTTIANVAFGGLTAGSKVAWDGARLRLRWAYSQVGSADSVQLRLTAAELRGTYDTGTGPPADVTAPVLTAAAVNGSSLTLTYDEPLDPSSTPAPGDIVVTANGNPRGVAAVAIGGSTVSVSITSAVISSDVVTASYVVPATHPIQDLAGNDATAFSGRSVTNTTPPTGGGGGGGGGGGTLPTILPTADGSRDTTIQVRGATLAYDAIDDTIAGADTASYLQDAQKAAGRAAVLLTDMPSDFGAMSSLAISIRARTVGRSDDQLTLYGQLLGADETTPLSSELLIATNPGTSSWATISNVSFGGLVPGSKAGWDGARLRLRWAIVVVGSADSAQLRVTAVELRGTYATSGPPPPDTTPPSLTSAAVNGSSLILTYDEPLDGGSVPPVDAFSILANGSPVTVESVGVTGSAVSLALTTPVVAGDSVTANYVAPAIGPIQDTAGNDAAGFAGLAVANGTPPPGAGGLPRFSHVYLIVLENKTIDTIIGSLSAPYLTSLADRYGLATNWYALADTSQPNYIGLFSGSMQGVTSNSTVDLPGRSLADQIEEAGLTWRVFAENVPTTCFAGSSASGGPDGSGTYRRKHEPAISFDRIRTDPTRCANITDFSHFAPGSAAFNLIVPNMCHDMHDCSIAQGDAFMSTFVPRIVSDPTWGPDDLLVVTFDEGTGTDRHIATIVVSDRVPAGLRSAVIHDHYSFVWTIESAWGMPCMNLACTANTFGEFFPGS